MSIRLRIDTGPVAGFGDRLALAERLIRAGARSSVVNEALETRGALRVLVTRMHRAMRRPDRPRGPLPSDIGELLGTRAIRLEASAFLSCWDQLRAAGHDPGLALADAWEATRVPSPPRLKVRRLTIDHAWVLARERYQLVVRRCTCCRAHWYEAAAMPTGPSVARSGIMCRDRGADPSIDSPPLAPAVDPRCPHCHPPLGTSAAAPDRRQASAPGGDARAGWRWQPSDALATLADRFRVAEALIAEGARLPVVAHLTSLPAGGVLRQLYIEVAGERPRQGALPQLGAHILSSGRLRLQSSVLVVTASRLLNAGVPASHALLGAWRTYQRVFGDRASFDINAAALVVRARRHPDFQLVTCHRCRAEHLALRSDLPNQRCPVCRSLRMAERRDMSARARESAGPRLPVAPGG